MSIVIRPIGKGFAAEVSGIALTGANDAAAIAGIWAAIDEYSVLVFREQSLSDAALRDFAARFGPLEIGRGALQPGPPQGCAPATPDHAKRRAP